MQGTLSKMAVTLGSETTPAQYALRIGDQLMPLNERIGQPLTLHYSGKIYCDACGRKTSKSYSQGHCFPCMKKLARCDMCIMKPETCHFAAGTCREPEWGERNCMIPHYVYLANTSGLKVGITRHSQVPTRWLDQGATQALPILRVATRQLSGLVEVALAQLVADKTNWRAMLKGSGEPLVLKAEAARLLPLIEQTLKDLGQSHGVDAIEHLDEAVVTINYPVDQYPGKIASHNFDKQPEVSGVLQGIKGQYLIFDTGVINIRKFTGYEIEAS
ncbi:DUF2797 domain-containing protein [Ferrimonas gelatinilytica]|uniref:DUF2797 domain-containing protein n=1 Tax=Ferrimonas gelatinilytica TaxID=1255257 RepID=A0ABP9S7J2_9GAMM